MCSTSSTVALSGKFMVLEIEESQCFWNAACMRYRSSAVLLIKASPMQYLRNVITAYGNFATPSTDFAHLADNRERIRLHAAIEETMLGRPLVARLERASGSGYYGSFYYVLFPAVLLLYGFQVTRRLRPRDALKRISQDAAPLFMATIVSYTIVVACAMELGENLRFKFVIEPVFLTLTAIVCYRMLRGTSDTDSTRAASTSRAPA